MGRYYSNGIGGGGAGGGPPKGGFPSFSMGPQHQKGEALKEYVSRLLCSVGFSGLMWVRSKSVDLTELAKEGKLDPTIGRDDGACLFFISARNALLNWIYRDSENDTELVAPPVAEVYELTLRLSF